jgi:FAD/FMN-containing dehydrogenase
MKGEPVAEWRNWAGNVGAQPAQVERPTTIEAVQELVAAAAKAGQVVRVAGAGHSFSPICATDGVLLDLIDLTGVTAIDTANQTATILGGTRIHQVGAPLFEAGLAIENQGDIDVQAIAGAIGTGTHGTGRSFGSFSSTLVACQIVTAAGELLTIDGADLETLRAARVSLGLLGVMVSVTLRVVPAYKLRRRSWPVEWSAAPTQWLEIEQSSRNPEFWWIPPLDTCVFKSFVASDDEVTGTPPAPTFPPGTIERYLPQDGVDWGWRAYPAIREHRFVEMEYTFAIDRGMDAFGAVRELMLARHPGVKWAVEFRTHAAEDAFLSVTQGEDSVTISVHDAADNVHWDFFPEAERLFRGFDGRPHWGKLNFLETDELRPAFPLLDRFVQVRRRLDPDGVFLNDYLKPILG